MCFTIDGIGTVKSKQRVKEHGEVFTAEREVNAMLDLVKTESYRIESKFLEPTCGDGNFLIKILERKVSVVLKNFKKNTPQFDKALLICAMSCYGIEILEDNAIECRNRLFNYICKFTKSEDVKKSLRHVININIVNGDSLTFKTIDGTPILFSEWSFLGNSVKRIVYSYEEMVIPKNQEEGIFKEKNSEIKRIVNTAVKTFSLIDYRCLYEQK